ncbi:MAG: DUF3987 domain-containing protein [Bacteroidia bacterium]
MKQAFDPTQWFDSDGDKFQFENEPPETSQPSEAPIDDSVEFDPNTFEQVNQVVALIEEQRLDLTAAYQDWLKLGFALADSFGEQGRDLYHRISCFYNGYSATECDKQFDNCLKANGNGVNINTFFYMAKQAGVTINQARADQPDQPNAKMPNIPSSVYETMPDFLQSVVLHCNSDEERDILLLGSLTTLSACLPNVYGNYGQSKVFANLFLFVTGQASAGKGILKNCRKLVYPIHKSLRDQSLKAKLMYDSEVEEYNQLKKANPGIDKPEEPRETMLLIPANNSSTGAYQLIHANNGQGLIFETEGDTLAQAFKSDYGNYSDGFRKAFHHEPINYYRRTDREYVEIEQPKISALLSGTPKQVATLIPNAENGLFSRFMFYRMNTVHVWNDVFANTDNGDLEAYYNALGETFHEYYKHLQANAPLEFCFTANQQERFNAFFREAQSKYTALQGDDFIGSVRRLGLIAFRIAMIFTVLRAFEDGSLDDKIICNDQDFENALTIIRVLLKHTSSVFSDLPTEPIKPKLKNLKEQFLDALPREFNRKEYLKVADVVGVKRKTAEGYITQFVNKGLLHRPKQDNYVKMTS